MSGGVIIGDYDRLLYFLKKVNAWGFQKRFL